MCERPYIASGDRLRAKETERLMWPTGWQIAELPARFQSGRLENQRRTEETRGSLFCRGGFLWLYEQRLGTLDPSGSQVNPKPAVTKTQAKPVTRQEHLVASLTDVSVSSLQ